MPNGPHRSRSDTLDDITDWMRQRGEAVAARVRPQARAAGHVLYKAAIRTGAALPMTTPMAGALADATRLKAAAGLVGREVAGLTGLGAVNGAVGQVVMDHALGRGNSASDTAGAALGGAVGTLGLLASRRPQASAALGGATTSMTQDLLGGRPVSVDEALQSAGLSGATSGLFAPLVSTRVNRLRPSEKGKLGERLSEGRSHLRGDAPREGAKPRVPVGGGKVAIPDHQTQSGLYVEAKFGPSASLSKNQTKAFSFDPDGFRLDHFLPQDVGAATAAIASNLAMTASRPRAKTDGSSPQNRQNRSRGR